MLEDFDRIPFHDSNIGKLFLINFCKQGPNARPIDVGRQDVPFGMLAGDACGRLAHAESDL
jgi:hypothetical protein